MGIKRNLSITGSGLATNYKGENFPNVFFGSVIYELPAPKVAYPPNTDHAVAVFRCPAPNVRITPTI